MADSTVLKDFMIRLGYQVDEASQRKFTDSLSAIGKTVTALGLGLVAAAAAVAHTVSEHAATASRLYQAVEGINRGGQVTATAAGLKDLAQAMLAIANIPQDQTIGVLSAIGAHLTANPNLRALWRKWAGEGTETEQLLKLRENLLKMQPVMQQAVIQSLGSIVPPDFINSLLRKGVPEAVEAAASRRTGLHIDLDQLSKDSDAHRRILLDMAQDWQGLLDKVTADVLPKLNQNLQSWHDWFEKNMPQIGGWIDDVTKKLGNLPGAQTVMTAGYLAQVSGVLPWLEHAGSYVLGAVVLNKILKARLGSILKGLGLKGGEAAAEGAGEAGAAGTGEAAGGAAAAGGASLGAILAGVLGGIVAPALAGIGLGAHLKNLGEQNPDNEFLNAKTGRYSAKARDAELQHGRHSPEYREAVGAGADSANSGPGLIARMWHGFWESIVGSAHAEELPENVKLLSQRIQELTDTIKDPLNNAAAGLSSWGNGLGRDIVNRIGGGGARGGAGGGSPLPTKDVPITDMSLNPIQAAFLKVLSAPESGGDYNVKNGGERFADTSKFPEGRGRGGESTASGRFQDISATWHRIEDLFFGGERNFAPERQDKGNWLWAERISERQARRRAKVARLLARRRPLVPGSNGPAHDLVMTPPKLARQIVQHFAPRGVVLDPCRGRGAFYNALKRCSGVTEARWCELANGRDFFAEDRRCDWIITNPPWSKLRQFLLHSMELGDNIVFLTTITHLVTRARLRDIAEHGFGLREALAVADPPAGLRSGFQLAAVHVQRGYTGGLAFSDGF